MVYYRKYRPQTIDQLDSKTVRDSLHAVLSMQDPPHAFLFTGPKGLGKTSTARIVAKVINCEKMLKSEKKTHGTRGTNDTRDTSKLEPCNQCYQCTSITNGSNVDISEIDGASNRNIDDVRDLKDKIKLSPAAARKKIYIIDEVHMFTPESFNALLKTLEEPPAHAMFILCTTEKNKVPATIVSRCFAIDFQPATSEELIRSFKRIADGEKLQIEDEALIEIAKLADGGFRDGAKALEELAALATERAITKALVEERYKVAGIKSHIMHMITSLEMKNVKESLGIVQKLTIEGVDIKQFIMQLLTQLHQQLLEEINRKDQKDSTKIGVEDIKTLLQKLSVAYSEMKYAVLPQLPLEIAIIDWCIKQPAVSQAKEETVEVQANGTNVAVKIQTGKPEVNVASMRKQVGDLARVKALYGEPKITVQPEDGGSRSSISLLHVANDAITPEWLDHFWNTLVAETKQHNHTIAGVLRGCTLRTFDTKILVIETAYKFHKERLDEGKTREMLANICKILTGNPVVVEVILKS